MSREMSSSSSAVVVGVVTGVMVAIEDLGKSERRECRLETC